MAVLKVVNYGNPILRKVCEPVRDFAKLDAIIADMFAVCFRIVFQVLLQKL